MSAVILMTLLSGTDVHCYVASDGTPGWKLVALPDEAPALAADEGIEQFRSDEPVTVVDERPSVAWVGSPHGIGKTGFVFTVGPGGRLLEVHFAQPLRGARVDVTAFDERGQGMALMRDRRVGGDALNLTWGTAEVRSVEVKVHDHLRTEPVVASWKQP